MGERGITSSSPWRCFRQPNTPIHLNVLGPFLKRFILTTHYLTDHVLTSVAASTAIIQANYSMMSKHESFMCKSSWNTFTSVIIWSLPFFPCFYLSKMFSKITLLPLHLCYKCTNKRQVRAAIKATWCHGCGKWLFFLLALQSRRTSACDFIFSIGPCWLRKLTTKGICWIH